MGSNIAPLISPQHSQVLTHLHDQGLAPYPRLRPDFAVGKVDGGQTQLVFLADAKYQVLESISGHTDSWTRVLAYTSEFTPASVKAQGKGLPMMIFYVGDGDKALPGNAPGIDVTLFPLRPSTIVRTASMLEAKVTPLVRTPSSP